MNLAELLRGVDCEHRLLPERRLNSEVAGLHHDSRKIAPGFVFVAMKGGSSDGNRYIGDAIRAGAIAVVTDSSAEFARASASHGELAWIEVAHGRRALAQLSANLFGGPAEKLKLTGVTGTNGKTTTTFLLAQLLRFAGRGEPVLIGTVEYHYARQVVSAPHTTPESLELNRIFAAATHPKLGKFIASEAVMEVSSHALAQERVYGLHFDVAVFTNLTRDHLDFHGGMEEYFAAKQKLFSACGAGRPRVAVINSDDPSAAKLCEVARTNGCELMTYGLQAGEIRAKEIELSPHGTNFRIEAPQGSARIRTPLVGRVNVYNLLAAATAALARGVDLPTVEAGLPRCNGAPGRFQRVDCGQPFAVIVDYAHTDDALRNLTSLAREFVNAQPQHGRVITLFGCGGDRDRSKRPLMGEAAGRGSDFVVLTSDNPRSEDPLAIIEGALPGLRSSGARHAVEPDRRKAIRLAIAEAKPGDIVLIAGKGHEKVQVTRAGSAHFDDAEEVQLALQSLGYGAATEARA